MDGWLRQGVLVKSAYRGVSHLAGTPDTDVRQAWSARLRVQDGRLGPGGSLALARVEGFLLPRDLDATVRFPHVVNQPGLRTWSLVWESCDEQLRSGVPGLTVVRSLVAVAPTVSEKVLRVGFDSARRRGHTSLDAARRRVEELVALGVDGAEVMLHMLSSPAAAAESEGERVLAAFLEPLGIDLEFGVSDVVPGRRLDAFERHILLAYESTDATTTCCRLTATTTGCGRWRSRSPSSRSSSSLRG